MTDKIHYKEIMWATRQLDCYAGENCDEEKPYWYVYAEGDMDGDRESSPTIGIDLRVLPRGVKVVVSVPICPKCGLDIECCEIDKSCDFDWHNWEVGKYA